MKSPILLFDPNPVAAQRLATQLRHAGFAAYVTFDGAAAVSSARGQQFASIVVIADLADSQMRRYLHELRDADSEACLIVISDPAVEGDRDVVRELGRLPDARDEHEIVRRDAGLGYGGVEGFQDSVVATSRTPCRLFVSFS